MLFSCFANCSSLREVVGAMRGLNGKRKGGIKVQSWCTIIVNLLLTVIYKKVSRKWAFSNLVSFCRLHLFNYIHLIKFLENPEKDWLKETDSQLELEFNSVKLWGLTFFRSFI